MYRAIIAITGMIMLTGCSELQVIGRSAMSELAADSISVESERYRYQSARKAKREESHTLVAKATVQDAKVYRSERKELWRNN